MRDYTASRIGKGNCDPKWLILVGIRKSNSITVFQLSYTFSQLIEYMNLC